MSAHVGQELEARGVAEVIVYLQNPPKPEGTAAKAAAGTVGVRAAGAEMADLAKYFVESERSLTSAVRAAAVAGHPWRRAARGKRAARAVGSMPEIRFYPHLGVMLGTVNRDGYRALQADQRVKAVAGTPAISLIRPRRKAAARLTRQVTWGVEVLRVGDLWRQGFTGQGILVGHLDTGVDGRHPALRRAIATFAEFDDLGRQVEPAPSPFDTDDHGTHTAATIAGRPVARRHVGVAPGAKLASAIVIEGGNVVARVLGGMDWAVGQGVRILSMSLGFRGWWEDFLPLTQLLRDRNILPVFAVGNEGPGTSRSPGNYPDALSVGASDRAGSVADFSSSQEFQRTLDPLVPDLLGPGVDVVSAKPGGGYQSMDGSSMATPHVAGLAALLMQARPQRSGAEIEAAIFGSCRRSAGMPPERANRGVPDGVRALAAL